MTLVKIQAPVVSSGTFFAMTSTASPHSLNDICIFCVVTMPFWALIFLKVKTSKTVRTSIIFCLRNRLKMVWVYAFTIFTQMIDMLSCGNFSMTYFIRKAMGPLGSFYVRFKFSVPIALSTDPVPTVRRFFYEFKKSAFYGFHAAHLYLKGGSVNAVP